MSKNRAKAKGKKQKQEEERDAAIYKVLTSQQVNELVEVPSVDLLEKKVAKIMKLEDAPVDLKCGAMLDYYTAALWWAREEHFTNEQMSLFVTIVHTLIENVKEKQMDLASNLTEFKGMLVGIGSESLENSTGMELFDISQARLISDYVFYSLFQHYKLYEYIFTITQAEEIIGTDLHVDVALDSSLPWPPPLEEAVTDAIYSEYMVTPPPTPQLEAEQTADAETTSDTEDQSDDLEKEQQADDLMTSLTPDQIKVVIREVMEEVIEGLQSEVASKLRDKENLLLQRISKIHIVEKKVES